MPEDYRIGEADIAGEGDEEVGDDDEVSAEDVEIGARIARAMRGGRRWKGRAPMRASTARVPGLVRGTKTGATTPYGQPVLAHKREERADAWAEMGLGAVTNPLAGPATLQQQFIERFKTGRMMLDQTGPGNLLNTVLIGMKPQGANLAARPVSAYANNAVGALVNYDMGEIGQLFTLNLTTVAAAQTLSGMAFGTVVKTF